MGSARKLDQSIESLRAFYHSVHDSERNEVIQLLGAMNDPDAARELIQLYGECEWRSTRLQIIRALAIHPTQRGLEFLFRIAQEPKDLPIAEAAVTALGRSHHLLAARFLNRFYFHCDEFLKASVVGALGQIPDRTLAHEFINELPKALKEQKLALAKNLVLTLGELKIHQAQPLLLELAASRAQPNLSLPALVALGKISRDPAALEKLAHRFEEDIFEYQLFTSVKTQVQFRSQWKLEDYLSRLFGGASFHRTLPFELSHFDPKDVKEGLKMFAGPEHFERLCMALAKLDFEETPSWYLELIQIDPLDENQLITVLESASAHQSQKMEAVLAALARHPKAQESAIRLQWILAVTLSLPKAEETLKKFFGSESYRALDEKSRVQALNSLIDYGHCAQSDKTSLQDAVRLLESLLESETGASAQGRVLRGLAHLRAPSKKAHAFVKAQIENEALSASCLQYLEHCPDKGALPSLSKLAQKPGKHLNAVLRAMAASPEKPDLETIAAQSLSEKAAPETRIEAIRLLAEHPSPKLHPQLLGALQDEPRVALAALIALKSLSDNVQLADATAEALKPLLESKNASLSGRALDTLTALPGLRAKRIVIDFLKERSEDSEVCDKIVRCLEAPDQGIEYFVGVVDGILKQNPRHPQQDGLVHLREKLMSGVSQSEPSSAKGADTAALDRDLATKIADYDRIDESVRTALRSAEVPFRHPRLYDDYVDKSSSVVEYCKAVDIHLEKTLGKKHLFPKLENSLHEFQNALHASGLGDDFPAATRVIELMELEKHFSAESLPLHKMLTLAQGVRTGRIVHERFKTLDGLRAWAVVLLIFGRRIQGIKPIIPVRNATDDQVASLCKRLIALQELRNPAAHRQTVLKFASIDSTRPEVVALINTIQKMF